MNFALLIRRTQPGGNQVLFSGWVSSHSISQAVSLFSGSAGSNVAAGKPWRTTFGGKLPVGLGGGFGRVNCPTAGVAPPPVRRTATTHAATSTTKPARRRTDRIGTTPGGTKAIPHGPAAHGLRARIKTDQKK